MAPYDEALLGGDATSIARQLEVFSENARSLSSNRQRLIEEHARHWVGVVSGTVAATGETIEQVISELKDRGFNPDDAIIRFIDREQKTLIL